MTLEELGWNEYKQSLDDYNSVAVEQVGRVIAEHKTNYTLITSAGECTGVLRGKTHLMLDDTTKPRVGDWVVCADSESKGVTAIESILPRFSTLRRHAAGVGQGTQVLVTNIDFVFIVQGLDQNFNINRLERYLVMVENSGAAPIVVLNKADLVEDADSRRAQVLVIAPHVPVVVLSSLSREGVHDVEPYLKPGTTSVFVGSSGVGKSTLLNTLLGDKVQETQGLRDDDQGKHTTTRRELFVLDNGAIVIDTPGMRELSVEGLDTLADTFSDIEDLTQECTFRDCDHERSEGCALQQAIAAGQLDAKRVANYMKLQKEIAYEESQVTEESKRKRKEQVNKLHKRYRKITRAKYKDRGFK